MIDPDFGLFIKLEEHASSCRRSATTNKFDSQLPTIAGRLRLNHPPNVCPRRLALNLIWTQKQSQCSTALGSQLKSAKVMRGDTATNQPNRANTRSIAALDRRPRVLRQRQPDERSKFARDQFPKHPQPGDKNGFVGRKQ